MKTPEQVAAEKMLRVMETVPLDDDSMAHWTGVLVAAIEADRAQRSARLEDLHAYDHFRMDEDEGREERILVVQIDTEPGIGRTRVYINDGRIYDGDPETGQEWSLT